MRISRKQFIYAASGLVAGSAGIWLGGIFSDMGDGLRKRSLAPNSLSTPESTPGSTPQVPSEAEIIWDEISDRFAMPRNLPIVVPRWVIDGEKFAAEIDGRLGFVRLIACDAPEAEQGLDEFECGFIASKRHLEGLLQNAVVRIERDEDEKDGSSRYWSHVWVNPTNTGKPFLANMEMIFSGHTAFRRESTNQMYGSAYLEAFDFALEQQSGILNTCDGFHSVSSRVGSQSAPAHVGDRIQVKGIEVTIDLVPMSVIPDGTPEAVDGLMVLSIKVFNARETGSFEFKPSRIRVRDNKEENQSRSNSELLKDQIGSKTLGRGESIQGKVYFEIEEYRYPFSVQMKVEDDFYLYWSIQS